MMTKLYHTGFAVMINHIEAASYCPAEARGFAYEGSMSFACLFIVKHFSRHAHF